MADDRHLQGPRPGRALGPQNRLDRRHGDHDENHDRRQGPRDLQQRVAVDPRRRRLSRTGPIPDGDVDQEALDNDEHAGREPQEEPEEPIDLEAEITGWVQRRLGERTGAGRCRQQGAHTERHQEVPVRQLRNPS